MFELGRGIAGEKRCGFPATPALGRPEPLLTQGLYWVKNEPKEHGNTKRRPERCPGPLWLKDYGAAVAVKQPGHSRSGERAA